MFQSSYDFTFPLIMFWLESLDLSVGESSAGNPPFSIRQKRFGGRVPSSSRSSWSGRRLCKRYLQLCKYNHYCMCLVCTIIYGINLLRRWDSYIDQKYLCKCCKPIVNYIFKLILLRNVYILFLIHWSWDLLVNQTTMLSNRSS